MALDELATNRAMRDNSKPVIFRDRRFCGFLEGELGLRDHRLGVVKFYFSRREWQAVGDWHDRVMISPRQKCKKIRSPARHVAGDEGNGSVPSPGFGDVEMGGGGAGPELFGGVGGGVDFATHGGGHDIVLVALHHQ